MRQWALLLLALLLASPTASTAASCSGKGEGSCIPLQPGCQFCGHGGSRVRGWETCLDNATGAGPCAFPVVTATAEYEGVRLAHSNKARLVENNYYFPREDINMSLFRGPTGKTYQCTWKGQCDYFDLAGTKKLTAAMWSYDTAGIGKCRGHPGCPSAYTCKDIIDFGSFDPKVTVVS
eukprot:gene13717-20979_t